jgi:hypothetical protein
MTYKRPEYIWNDYYVEFTKYDERIIQRLKYLDVVGEPRRRVGDSVTVNVNKQKRIGIIKGTL